MAHEEHLSILKQGVEVWNRWREENPLVVVDLRRAKLARADLVGTNLRGASLGRANLSRADLEEANLVGAHLFGANLSNAILSNAILSNAQLIEAKLIGAKLSGANLVQADLRGATLEKADLRGATLTRANLSEATLEEADLRGAQLELAFIRDTNLRETQFSSAVMIHTVFGNIDLSETLGLEEIRHLGPSQISTDTLLNSRGQVPEDFLIGCGLSDWEIEVAKLYNPDLSNKEVNDIQYKMYDLRATQALQISPLFISYSHKDGTFVDKIADKLTKNGLRFWRDIHDMKSGRMETQIDRAIRQNPTVLLVISENSLDSDWVEHEVRTARQVKKEVERDVLCPIALDDNWKNSRWPKRVMEQIMEYNILDFSEWKDESKFDGMFRKLIDGLELFYKD